jgi:formylglycine-generating enzyme required for sulfatase activity
MVYVEGSGSGIFAVEGFYIGKYEVTQAQYQAIMGTNPSRFKGGNNPVEQVSWNDAQEFITNLNARTGRNYRLPTEDEWEYAAREGTKKSSYAYPGSDDIGEVAWYDGNSGGQTHPVGQKSPNALGIYDMGGNVYEWCQDCSSRSCSSRVYRGGSWNDAAVHCRVASRYYDSPGFRRYYLGVRLALP